MITLAHPWVLWLVALPPVLRLVLRPYREPRQAVRAPWFGRLAGLLGVEPGEGAVIVRVSWPRLSFQWAMWALVVLALARPQLLEDPIRRIVPTRDLLLLVDLSGSMEAEDFTDASGNRVDRLTAVKQVLDEFLTRREGDRVGLVVFGSAAFVQVPFTEDLDACRMLLEEVAVRMAGPRTAFGDAIGLGITLFEESEVEERVMIALTDGNDTGSKVPPPEAAKIAADNDILIHVVGMGDPSSVGEQEFDEAALLTVADTTGGGYFFAQDRDELTKIYDELDRLDTRDVESESYRPRIDLFYWPLAGFLFGVLSLHAGILMRKAWRTRKVAHG